MEDIKYGEYIDSWYRSKCPYCEAVNWIDNGNEQDISGIDADACNCWKCKKLFRLSEYDALLEEIRGEDSMIYETNGQEKPNK